MIKRNVKLNTVKEIDTFNKLCSSFDCEMDLSSGKYYVDAKSIMGIFSLNLDLPMVLIAGTDDENAIDEVFKDFIIS